MKIATDKIENPAIQQFIIEAKLISPIEDIIKKIYKREFRECDIKWLDNKLTQFIDFAAETLGLKVSVAQASVDGWVFNEYVENYFLEKFNALLAYFKKFDQSL